MEYQGRGSALSILLLFMATSSSAYMIYRVGDDDGWTTDANGLDYTKWASDKSFQVGDMLVFAYSSSNHTVVQTGNKDAFDNCNVEAGDAKIWSAEGSSSANVLLTTSGTTYFLCTAWEGSHCRNGMKFGINVLDTGSSNGLMPPIASPTIPSDSTTSPSPISELTPPNNTPGSTTPDVFTKPSSDSNSNSNSNSKSPGSSGAHARNVVEMFLVSAIALGVQLVF